MLWITIVFSPLRPNVVLSGTQRAVALGIRDTNGMGAQMSALRDEADVCHVVPNVRLLGSGQVCDNWKGKKLSTDTYYGFRNEQRE
jgi:hypothetical protein